MKKRSVIKQINILVLMMLLIVPLVFIPLPQAYAATTPGLGFAATFGILSSTYTNTASGTTINGDLGYTTPPATAPTVTGSTYTPPSTTYSTAGTDQGSALTNLNGQACTFTFASGAIDLATDTTHGPIGVYTPGVYCTSGPGAASIGAGGITLSGTGTYIFKVNGSLTTVANSVVTLSNGASSCDVFWAPIAATTLGANSTFAGTDIDASGITIGSTITWVGRALAFGGTVSTTTDTITVPTCASPTGTPTPTVSSTSGGSSSTSSNGVAACPSIKAVTPIIISSKRLSPTSISLTWGPYSGVDTFIVSYGLKNGEWIYNTNVTGFSTVLNALPVNDPIWVEVAARNGCSVGSYSQSVFVGGPSLPNTGFKSTKLVENWYSVFEGSLGKLVLDYLITK